MVAKWSWFGTRLKEKDAIASLEMRLAALEESQLQLQQSINEIKALVTDTNTAITNELKDECPEN